jgi:hypothetical protein
MSFDRITWLARFKQFIVNNQLISTFIHDCHAASDQWRIDFLRQHPTFGKKFLDQIAFDSDMQYAMEKVNITMNTFVESAFQFGFFVENFLQDYMNK